MLDLTFKQNKSKKKPCLVFTAQTVTTQVGQEHITKLVFHSNCIAKVNKADNHIIQQQYVCSSELNLPFLHLRKVSYDLQQNRLNTEKYISGQKGL